MSKLHRASLAFICASTGAAHAITFEDESGNKYLLGGFAKVEISRAGQATQVVPDNLSNFTFDNRNALSKPAVGLTTKADRNSELSMQEVNLGWSRETDSAIGLEARMTYRWRSGESIKDVFRTPDVDYRNDASLWKKDFTEKYVGISRPDLGSLKVGTQLSRSWSRSDSFSYPIGLSSQWADSGAGFGVLPTALRVASPVFEDGSGKITGELTLATNERNTEFVQQSRFTGNGTPFSPGATKPRLAELFLQFSNQKNLVEFTVLSARGAKQTAFGKSALVGWIGDPDTISPANTVARNAGTPSQSQALLQGNHWPNPENMLTWGIRRNQWSGSAASCNFNVNQCLFGIDPGFNYGPASTNYRGYRARNWDAMLGWTRYDGLYNYTIGGVYFSKAKSDNPIEWGQSNSAVSINLGLGRKIPEISKGLSASAGLAFSRFAKLGPAPLSMPNNTFLGPNSLYDKTGYALTLGLVYVF
ncbi:MAG: hypothetical protein V4731_00795 [Pseudomonadota bacterium]